MGFAFPSGIFASCASVHLVGIKGTGVCALAELLHGAGMKIGGSDTPEVFHTDAILGELGIPFHDSFDRAHVGDGADLVIHSAAYGENNEEIAEARRKSIPVASYPQALGEYSRAFDSSGIAGVHGKTTTTAMCGCLMRALELPARILAGSAVPEFAKEGRVAKSTLVLGDKYFIAETCEYRRHFLHFRPKRIVLTSVESDHQDCFPTYESIRDAFVEYCGLIPKGGRLIYCADDPGACEVADTVRKEGRNIDFVPYGFSAAGDYGLNSYQIGEDGATFRVNAFGRELSLRLPGRHQALNAAAALALSGSLLTEEFGANGNWNSTRQAAAKTALARFSGSARRSEVIGEAGGILFMDDYGHHPTAIAATLSGLRDFHRSRRIVVSFMSHTFSRTAALLEEFARALAGADVLFLHKIYASARERFDGHIDGMSLHRKIENLRSDGRIPVLRYADEPDDAFKPLTEILRPGDLFLTLGAGNNRSLGVRLFEHYRGMEPKTGSRE